MPKSAKGPRPSHFPVTRWTVIHRMGDGKSAVKLQGWSEFAETYWPALVSWLERRGVCGNDAQDLVQGFLAKLWSADDFTSGLSPQGGKLRSFLLKSLCNWQKDRALHDNCLKRGGASTHLELSEVISSSEEELYDQVWAHATLRQACFRLRKRYLARGNSELFDLALPLIDARSPEQSREVETRLKMTANTLSVSIKRMRERLATCLREEVAATLVQPSEAQIDDEIRHLLIAFGGSGSFGELVNSLSHSE